MAITGITYEPQDYRTVYNPIEYVATSNKTSEDRFKYIVEVYDGATKIGTLKIPADPSTYGRADVQGIMESYLTKNLGTINTAGTGVAFEDCNNSYKEFTIKFGEEYEVLGVLTVFMTPAYDTTLITFNGCLPNYRDTLNFVDYQVANKYLDYVDNSATRKFLTNAAAGSKGKGQKVELTDKGFTYLLNDHASDPITGYDIATYNSSGVIIAIHQINNTIGAAAKKMLLIPTAPDSINNIDTATYITGAPAQPLITSSVADYLITLRGVGAASETIWFTVDSECRYEVRRLEFLNSLGGFDTFNFTKVSRKSETIERKFYKQNADNMVSGVIDYSLQDKVKTQYYTRSSPKIKLNSDNLSVDVYNWLLELIESPEIYLWENGERIAIQNITSDWEEKRADTDSVFNLEIDLELGIDNYRQRG